MPRARASLACSTLSQTSRQLQGLQASKTPTDESNTNPPGKFFVFRVQVMLIMLCHITLPLTVRCTQSSAPAQCRLP